jgi:hypothetical protein
MAARRSPGDVTVSSGPSWPGVNEQLAAGRVEAGTALEALILANQDFEMLRPEELTDRLGIPLWLRVMYRKNHPDGRFIGPSGGYPHTLRDFAEWTTEHQDLLPEQDRPGGAG